MSGINGNGKAASTEVSHNDGAPSDKAHSPTSPAAAMAPASVPTVPEAKLLRKIDFRVLPILFLVYVVAFLDRVNMSNALTLGLPDELGLTGQQPNVALTIFFVPYILFEIPSNLLMKKLSPHLWLSACILVFGVITIAQGFVKSYSGILATRFFLGLAEAGIFPGSFYLISFWYRQQEAQARFTAYWCSTIFASAFGSLLASGIANMDGLRGLTGWRWVFILEGVVTVLVAALAYFTITDFPREAKWLTEDERAFVMNKTESKESVSHPVTVRDVLAFLAKPKHWLGALMYFSILIPAYSFVYFTPTIVQGLGYGTIQTQLHSVPPFAATFGLAVVLAVLSDRMRVRSPFILFSLCFLIAGTAICMQIHGVEHFSAEYAGLCLAAMGSLGVGGNIVCWYIMNLRGHVERAIGSAWMICFGNIGGIVATFAFQKKDAPLYHTGYSLVLSMAALCFASCAGYALIIWRERKDAATVGTNDKDDVRHELYL
ncbi:MFS general substrate transporter [Apiospora phragmitis]|uniref:MFS general substrate transporter n=1 Tax=Apiospora phragmitis TaxID=2905665 RepID=A0ABR1TAD9_9PEZI